ncbi:short-chain dehydrogenase TIC 32, chloroplastic-like protein [Tanacetum coccineum]
MLRGSTGDRSRKARRRCGRNSRGTGLDKGTTGFFQKISVEVGDALIGTPKEEKQNQFLSILCLLIVPRPVRATILQGLPLNILIGNAGIMTPPLSLSKDGIESQFATNYLGTSIFHLTNLLLDTMKNTAKSCGREGRIVLVSSRLYKFSYKGGIMFDKLNDEKCYNSFYAYGQSKLATILHAKELARRLKEEGADITVNALHPGVITTNLARHSNFLTCNIVGASTTCFLALNPKAKEFSGEYFMDNNVATVSGYAKEAELAKKLWECGMELTASK